MSGSRILKHSRKLKTQIFTKVKNFLLKPVHSRGYLQFFGVVVASASFVVGTYFGLYHYLLPKLRALEETQHILPTDTAFNASGYDDGSGTTVALSSEVRVATSSVWWNANWDYKKQITITNQSGDTLAASSSAMIVVDTKALYDAGKLQDDADDLRIVYYATQSATFTQLTRTVEPSSDSVATSRATKIIFPLQTALADGDSDNQYWIYYGNSNAVAPSGSGFDITQDTNSTISALLRCGFNGTTSCDGGETPTTSDGAIRFKGRNSAFGFSKANYISIPYNSLLDFTGGPITIEFWARPQSDSPYGRIIKRANSGQYYISESIKSANQLTFTYGDGSVTSEVGSFVANEWQHVAAVYDGQYLKIYINGQEKGSVEHTVTATSDPDDVVLMGWEATFGAYNNYSGALDEVRLSRVARDIATNWANGVYFRPLEPDDDTVFLFHFDEYGDDPRQSGKVIDASKNALHGNVVNPEYLDAQWTEVAGETYEYNPANSAFSSHYGVFLEEAITNKITNPSFDHATFNTNWISGSNLGLSEETARVLYGAKSAKLVPTPFVSQTSRNSWIGLYDATDRKYLAQEFVPESSGTVYAVSLSLYRVGAFDRYLQLEIQTDDGGVPSGTPITGGVSDCRTHTNSDNYKSIFTFENTPSISAGTTYHLVLKPYDNSDCTVEQSTPNTSNYVRWGFRDSDVYTSGDKERMDEAGTWVSDTTHDLTFIIEDTTSTRLVTSVDVGNTNAHSLSCYVKKSDGSTIDSKVADLVWDDNPVTPTYEYVREGWWRLKYENQTGIVGAANYGVRARFDNTIYVDACQLEEKEVVTTYVDGELDNSSYRGSENAPSGTYSWSGVAHESTSTRTAGTLTYSKTGNINANEGTVSLWVNVPKEAEDIWSNNQYETIFDVYNAGDDIRLRKEDGGLNNRLRVFFWNGGQGATYNQSFSPGEWHHIAFSWRANGEASDFINIYVDGDAGTQYSGTLTPQNIGDINLGRNVIISDLRIYDSALSEANIVDIYYQGLNAHSADSENDDKYLSSGTYISPVIDLFPIAQWATAAFSATSVLNGGSIVYYTSTSADNSTWESWQQVTGSTIASTVARYLKIKAEMTSPSSLANTPVLTGITISYIADATAPTNPTSTTGLNEPGGGTTLTSGNWYSYTSPYFSWTGADDPGDGASGVAGYYVYFGTDPTADPQTAGTYRTSANYTADLSAISSPSTFYLRIKTKDNAGNISSETYDAFTYKYDNVAPTNPAWVSCSPSGYTATNQYTFTWPEGSDSHSGIYGYCFKTDGVKYTSECCIDKSVGTGTCDAEEVNLSCSSGICNLTLTSIADIDNDGVNVFYVRTKDASGNTASSYITVSFYYAGSSPTAPTNLSVSPDTSSDSPASTNSFTFSWNSPESYSGAESNLTYYYSINAVPSESNSTATSNKSVSGAFATQQGTNTFYVVAKDEAGNINWNTYASINFYCSTTAPGVPTGITIADASVRASSDWALTVKWVAPTTGGTVDHYNVYRCASGCTSDSNYTKIAETSATAYTDTGLSNTTDYYYKIKAVDNAGAMSAFSSAVHKQPAGKYSSCPTTGSPSTSTTPTTATITWTSDREGIGYVDYGLDTSYGKQRVASSSATTSHSVKIVGLSYSTTYHFRIRTIDSEPGLIDYDMDDCWSGDYSFTTGSAPTIKDVAVSDITNTSAIITWETTTVMTSKIEYGTTVSYGTTVEDTSTGATTKHTIKLTDLEPGTLYHFKVSGADSDGNTLYTEDHTFETLAYPVISKIRLEQDEKAARATVKVTWETNVKTSSIATYYPKGKPELAKDAVSSKMTTKHELIISGLLDDAEYILIAKGYDSLGNLATSAAQHFKTDVDTRPPVIENLNIETAIEGVGEEAQAQLIISWDTDEPATAQVEYGPGSGGEYSLKSPKDDSLLVNHLMIVSNLDPGKAYHLRAISEDQRGNPAYSDDYIVITPKATQSALDIIINSLSDSFGFLGKFGFFK